MGTLNPAVKETEDYLQTLWDHLHIMGEFKLEVDSPFEKPEPEVLVRRPEIVSYTGSPIKYRYYGRNCQNMVRKAGDMEDGQSKRDFIDLLASFMKNSSKNWNNEALSQEAIIEHLGVMSESKLKLTPEDLTIYEMQQQKRRKYQGFQGGGNGGRGHYGNQQQGRRNYGNSRGGKNFRKYK
jgi:hypothetical protein